VQLDELCMACLTQKHKHVEHCNQVNQCVKGYQKYSRYFGHPVGNGNSRSYTLFIVLAFIVAILLQF